MREMDRGERERGSRRNSEWWKEMERERKRARWRERTRVRWRERKSESGVERESVRRKTDGRNRGKSALSLTLALKEHAQRPSQMHETLIRESAWE